MNSYNNNFEQKVLNNISKIDELIAEIENGDINTAKILNTLKRNKSFIRSSSQEIELRYYDSIEFKKLVEMLSYYKAVDIQHHEIRSKFSAIYRALKNPNQTSNEFVEQELHRLQQMLENLADQNSFRCFGFDFEKEMKTLFSDRQIKLSKPLPDEYKGRFRSFIVIKEIIENAKKYSNDYVEVHYDEAIGWIISSKGEAISDKELSLLTRFGYSSNNFKLGAGLYFSKMLSEIYGFYIYFDKNKELNENNTFIVSNTKQDFYLI